MTASKRLIAVDPGLRHLGVASFTDGLLEEAFLVKNPEKSGRGAKAWHGYNRAAVCGVEDYLRGMVSRANVLVVELQQIYRRGPGDPDDMLQVAGVAGVIVGMADLDAELVGYRPREWKGSTPKAIFTKRILARLHPEELAVVELIKPASLRHNTVDAVGLGLKYLGRL